MDYVKKKFAVVEVNGQFYECERPRGAQQIQVCVEWDGIAMESPIKRVWIEAEKA
jgi:hypothetical protein